METAILTTAIGAILNAGTFIGGNYLARYLSGKDQDKEKKDTMKQLKIIILGL